VPAALFWSVPIYDPVTGSGLDNGQAFPSLNTIDKPALNADGSTDIYFGPNSPGGGKNWLRTLPDKGFFVILRLYGPKQEFFDQTWKPGNIEKIGASASAAAGREDHRGVRPSWLRVMRSSRPGRWSTCTTAGSPSRRCRSRCCPVRCPMAPLNRLTMLTDYIAPEGRLVACFVIASFSFGAALAACRTASTCM
jgi:hypothetical protein